MVGFSCNTTFRCARSVCEGIKEKLQESMKVLENTRKLTFKAMRI